MVCNIDSRTGQRHRPPLSGGLALAVACILALLLPLEPAHATIVVRLELDELIDGADTIALADVTRVESHWDDTGRIIVTDVTVHVDEGLKNCAAGDEVTFTIPGGAVDDLAQSVAGVPAFEPGERVVVFLERYGNPERIGLRGLGQGKFSLVTTAASPNETVAIPAVDDVTLADVEVVDDPDAPGGTRRVVRDLNVPAALEPMPVSELLDAIRSRAEVDPGASADSPTR